MMNLTSNGFPFLKRGGGGEGEEKMAMVILAIRIYVDPTSNESCIYKGAEGCYRLRHASM